MKRSYWSFWILLSLFLLSLPAEMFFNDKPLMISVDGKWYFPFARNYTYEDFGDQSASKSLMVDDYQGDGFTYLIRNAKRVPDLNTLFGSNREDLNDQEIAAQCAENEKLRAEKADIKLSHDVQIGPERKVDFTIMPLIEHSYKSTHPVPGVSRQGFVPPFDRKGGPNQDQYQDISAAHGHLLGTDKTGRDVLARLVYGFRISLLFGIALAFTGAFFGTIIGAIQGYFGGWVDLLGQRATEIWAAIPQLFLLMILSAFLTKRFFNLSETSHYLMLFCVLNLTAWMGMASYMRAEFLRARNLEYVKAARALGLSDFKIMMRHILPNSLTPIVTFLPFNISAGLLALVSLDFLGFGVKYPAPSLGELLSQGQENLAAWWIILPAFVVIAVTLILLTFVGEGVRKAFDPRAK